MKHNFLGIFIRATEGLQKLHLAAALSPSASETERAKVHRITEH